MIVIAVSGRQDRGKTHSIIRFEELLIQELGKNNTWYKEQPFEAEGEDIRRIVKLTDASICICSGGDDEQTIQKNFNLAKQNQCDILVSAVRHKWNNIPSYFHCAMDDDELLIEFPTAFATDKKQRYQNITGSSFEIIYQLNAKNILHIVKNVLQMLKKA